MNTKTQNDETQYTDEEIAMIENVGRQAFKDGVPANRSRYIRGSILWKAWNRGWNDENQRSKNGTENTGT